MKAKPSNRLPRTNGFTLVELLVVIAIIGVLVAMLLPALGRSRHHVMIATCAARLHQLYIGLSVYENDWHDMPLQFVWGGSAREASSPFYDVVVNTMHASWEKTAWCPSETYNTYGMGYHYFGNYTWTSFWAPYQGPFQRRTMEGLAATAVRARQVVGGALYQGRWLLMADRVQVLNVVPTAYDFAPPSQVHATGATAHVVNGGVSGSNMLWVDGAVQWRSIPDAYRLAPMGLNVNTGSEGWVHIAAPYTDDVLPVEAIDITITWFTPAWQVQPNLGGSAAIIAGY